MSFYLKIYLLFFTENKKKFLFQNQLKNHIDILYTIKIISYTVISSIKMNNCSLKIINNDCKFIIFFYHNNKSFISNFQIKWVIAIQ